MQDASDEIDWGNPLLRPLLHDSQNGNVDHRPDGGCDDALVEINPKGFTIRHPPEPHELDTDITPDSQLFHTIHMGAAVVDPARWRLVVDGLVEHSFALSLAQLKAMPSTTVTTFHECYGSPLKPPTTPLWRIGNVRWTGVRLATILAVAQPLDHAKYVWSEGLEHGQFADIVADNYQKDLPLDKARDLRVLLAYELNGEPLSKERGFPVRLVVPGWFGTNSTKWLGRLSLQEHRAPGPFTTKLYNEIDPGDPTGKRMRPVWAADVNSMICRPRPSEVVVIDHANHQREPKDITVWGRAWGSHEVDAVQVSADGGMTWSEAQVEPRRENEWQRFETCVALPVSPATTVKRDQRPSEQQSRERFACSIMARAKDRTGTQQPLEGRRNHVHKVDIEIVM